MEQDAGRIATILGNVSSANEWQARAGQRRQSIDR
jgi:hypothetical protein